MFERPDSAFERAVLACIEIGHDRTADDIDEFRLLAESAGVDVVAVVRGSRAAPDARYFVGSGKLDELRDHVVSHEADLVIFDHPLSPSQERNIERVLQCRVLDRNTLILDIFSQRARSFEGKLQVELAQLQHLSTRLVRGWTHLERQKGGIGLRGPGETQLETDRRLLAQRVKALHKRLERIERQRTQGRRARMKAELPTVSLVGYTNAGKSTLFNLATGAGVYAANQLFATLDPTLRRFALPRAGTVVFADTVGFVRNLPHELIAAFRATLLEATEATVLLHVVDASDPERLDIRDKVNEVLREIGASELPQIEVYNKIDLLADEPPRIDRNAEGRPVRVWLSARTGAGLDLLYQAVDEYLSPDVIRHRVVLPSSAGRLRARLYAVGKVRSERTTESGEIELDIELKQTQLDKLRGDKEFGVLHLG